SVGGDQASEEGTPAVLAVPGGSTPGPRSGPDHAGLGGARGLEGTPGGETFTRHRSGGRRLVRWSQHRVSARHGTAFLYRTPTVRYTFVRTPPDRGAGGRGCSGRSGGPGPRANSGSSGRSGGGGFAPTNRKADDPAGQRAGEPERRRAGSKGNRFEGKPVRRGAGSKASPGEGEVLSCSASARWSS